MYLTYFPAPHNKSGRFYGFLARNTGWRKATNGGVASALFTLYDM
jgi:hypothetical protein